MMQLGDAVSLKGVGCGHVIAIRGNEYCSYLVAFNTGSGISILYPFNTEIEKIDYPSITQSQIETFLHIHTVKKLLRQVEDLIFERFQFHDKSKLESPEKEIFEEYTSKLKATTYGSEEYRQYLKQMKPALDHHYANNRHHPEHFENGIQGMNLIDLIEMFVDWKAATLRHADGNIERSVEVNQKRFGYSDDLKQIFLNTIPLLEEKNVSDF